ARRYKGVKIPASDVSRTERRPSHGQRIQAVAVLQLVCDESPVLAAAARNDHVVVTCSFPVPVAQVEQLALALPPVHMRGFELGEVARRADAVLIEGSSRPLVREGALIAEGDANRRVVESDDIAPGHARLSFATRSPTTGLVFGTS